MSIFITYFTPTYNRGYILSQLYQSLCIQSDKDFEWIIVDDGSTDNTKDLVNDWILENRIKIKYFYQTNSGKSQAHNLGVTKANGKLFSCIDSDDYIIPETTENIRSQWERVSNDVIGLVYSRGTDSRESITKWGPKNQMLTLKEAYEIGLSGDTMLIYATDKIRKYSFPKLRNEKFVPESYLYDLLDDEGKMYFSSEILYICNYLDDGYTKSMRKLIYDNPNGYLLFITNRLKKNISLKHRFQNSIRYVAIKKILNSNKIIVDSVYPIHTLLAYPFGLYFYFKNYAKYRKRK